jgi:hypothetical protein
MPLYFVRFEHLFLKSVLGVPTRYLSAYSVGTVPVPYLYESTLLLAKPLQSPFNKLDQLYFRWGKEPRDLC